MSSSKTRATNASSQPFLASKVPQSTMINGIRIGNEPDSTTVISVMANHGETGELFLLSYTNYRIVGNGSFGVVFQAKLVDTDEYGAIKKVLQDKRFKNRELEIMRLVRHPNIVSCKAFFYTNGEKKDEVFLNLVLEFLPQTVYRNLREYTKQKQHMPALNVKLFMYQLFRSLAYIHSLGVCHRDIKPQNLLLDNHTGVLKLCDFGSAKILVPSEPNVSYICSRYYRAPELIFGATNYTTAIDIWSAGCVMAELMLGQPIFPGDSGVDQLVEIIKVLGTPTREQIKAMNHNYTEYKFPQIKACVWTKIFRNRPSPEALSLLETCLAYTPSTRLTASEAMLHPFFDELRDPATRFMEGRPLPALFNFTQQECDIRPDLTRRLIPMWADEELAARGIDMSKYTAAAAQ